MKHCILTHPHLLFSVEINGPATALPQLPPALPQSAGCHHPLHGTARWLDLITFGDQKNLKNRASQMLHVTQAHFQTEQIP